METIGKLLQQPKRNSYMNPKRDPNRNLYRNPPQNSRVWGIGLRALLMKGVALSFSGYLNFDCKV